MSVGVVIFILVLAVLFWLAYKVNMKEKRERLLKKYGNVDIVEKIMEGKMWQGQTVCQLKEAGGEPSSVSEKVLKTKIKHTYNGHSAPF